MVILHVKLAHYYKVNILHRLTLHIPTSTSESSTMSWSAKILNISQLQANIQPQQQYEYKLEEQY